MHPRLGQAPSDGMLAISHRDQVGLPRTVLSGFPGRGIGRQLAIFEEP